MTGPVPTRVGILEMLRSSVNRQYVIPVYQRHYTWEANKEVKQFFGDYLDVLTGKNKNHFLGIIIHLQKQLDAFRIENSVIDGQQRLTTIFLMLYAIKRLYIESNDENSANDLEQYLNNPSKKDKSFKYKLKPLVSDNNDYLCIVENKLDDIKSKDSNIIKNYEYLYNNLKVLIEAGYILDNITSALEKLYVVLVPIAEEDNAQKIFESINATGTKLTAADLIRNYLLMDLDSETQEDYYNSYWKEIEKNVSSDSKELELFFRMYLAIKKYNLITKSRVYREFEDWYETNDINLKSLFIELVKYSKIYYELNKLPINSVDNDFRIEINDFRKLDSDIPLSAIMKFYELYKESKIDGITFNSLMKTINSYMIRRSLCDLDSQNISRTFPSVLKNVITKCNNNYQNIVSVFNQELIGNNIDTSASYMPTDKQMYDLLFNANVYRRKVLKLVLDRIELNENPAPVDLSKLSIEHLMPQTPTEQWLQELDTTADKYADNLHRLGNLTLVSKYDNSFMGNSLWEFKNEVIKNTAHIKLNISLAKLTKWNFKEIDNRTKSLIETICKIYPYPNNVTRNYNVDEELTGSEAIQIGLNTLSKKQKLQKIYKNVAYQDSLNNGYILATAKGYKSNSRMRYWTFYTEDRFNYINNCDSKHLILCCRFKNDCTILNLPKDFLDAQKEYFYKTTDENNNVKYYNILVFIDDSSIKLSEPERNLEIDISKYKI